MKRFISFMLAVLLVFSLAACTERETPAVTPSAEPTSEPTAEPTAQPTAEPTSEPTADPVSETEPPYRSFFTGEGLSEPDYTRPFAVMINNINVAQPQCGIGNADIIYEVLAEGGITRMMAIFSNVKDAGVIGSMRSIRHYYVDIALAYGAVAVHAGYSQQAIQRIKDYGVNNICGVTGSYASKTFYRDQNRMANGYEHSLFTTGEKLYNCAEGLGYPLTVAEDYDNGLRFTENGTPENGEAADSIEISFSGYKTMKLTYHEDTGLYTGFQHGNRYYDGDNNTDVTFRNVMVLYADTKVIDSYGRLDVKLTGEGTGYFACGGKYEEISWSRKDLNSPFEYTLKDGSQLELGVGKSYIAVIATDGGKVTFE